jgi:hypothetical protein
MKSVKPLWMRWFDVIVLSILAVSICLVLGRLFDIAGISVSNVMNGFCSPAHFVFLSGAMSLLWFVVIKLGGARLSDLRSLNTLRHPPIWIPMLIGSICYLWSRNYIYAPPINPVSFEWRSFVVTAVVTLAGIVFAGIYYLVMVHEQKVRKEPGKETAVTGLGNSLDALAENPANFIEWLAKETPVAYPNEDYFDLKIYAWRVAGVLRESPLKTMTIAGPYGCGKSSILRMIDFYLFHGERSDGLARSCFENGKSYVDPKSIITCSVSGWGFQEHKLAEYILSSAVKELSHHVDCVGLADLPSHYRTAISGSGSMWAKMLASCLKRLPNPMDVLRQMDSVLSSIDKRLVVYIEDLDRNFDDESFWREASSLLDRLKDLDHVSFILAIGTPKNEVHADTLLRIAEHIEIVPPLAWHQLNTLIGSFRELCLRAFEEDIRCQSKEEADERFGLYHISGSERDQIEQMLGLYPNKPINGITDLLMTPRTAKAALRRTWQTWQTLHGEIDLDDLLVGNVIRSVAPEVFTFLNKNVGRLRLLGREAQNSPSQAQRQTREREKLNNEYSAITTNSQINPEAMSLLISFLFPGWTEDKFYKPAVRQGVALPPQPTDYWERLTKESLDGQETPDQEVLKKMAIWKASEGQETGGLARNLLDRAQFVDKVYQFGSMIDGREVRRLAEQLFSLILCRNERRSKHEQYKGFLELWRLSMDRPVDDHENWVLKQIQLAFPISLRFANDIYYYWHNTDRNMITIDHPQPELRNGVISAARSIYGNDPTMLVRAIEPGLHYSLFYLIIMYSQPRYGGLGLEVEDWDWIADTILKAGTINPDRVIPELIGLAVRGGREGPGQFDLETINHLFTDRVPEAMRLLLTEFDESGSKRGHSRLRSKRGQPLTADRRTKARLHSRARMSCQGGCSGTPIELSNSLRSRPPQMSVVTRQALN